MKIKLCGLSQMADIEAVNRLKPEYIGFVFASKSKRYVSPEKAKKLKKRLLPQIQSVGVFVNESVEVVADLLNQNVIDVAQLHGNETTQYIEELKSVTNKTIIQAFKIREKDDIRKASKSIADFVLLDSGAGTGMTFNWSLIKNLDRPYFLAGGLDAKNVTDAMEVLSPYGVDVSSGIESDGKKDECKMKEFVLAVRKDR